MKCSHKREACGIVIRLEGELDHHEAAPCMEYIEKILTLYASDAIFLDLSGLSFMDSSGIAVVLCAQRSLIGAGQSLTVVGTPPHALRIFRAAGLFSRIHFEAELPKGKEADDDAQ